MYFLCIFPASQPLSCPAYPNAINSGSRSTSNDEFVTLEFQLHSLCVSNGAPVQIHIFEVDLGVDNT